MSPQFGLITPHPHALSLPQPLPNTLPRNTGTAASTRRKISELQEVATRIELSALDARQGDFSNRSLYVLITSLALVALSMTSVAVLL
jgi:hypothetical protein